MGSSKKQTVGYKYHLGMHMILCHGPIDFFSSIKVDDRPTWNGQVQDGTVTIAAENLFGGESREGGVSGPVKFCSGKPDQVADSYLEEHCGPLVPAYRGVAGAI